MTATSISDLRANLSEAIETAQTEAVIVERNGSPVAVLISPERYEVLMSALEDAEDVEAFDAAVAEGGEPIPWDVVMKDLGWTT